jgi:hypothetical protein
MHTIDHEARKVARHRPGVQPSTALRLEARGSDRRVREASPRGAAVRWMSRRPRSRRSSQPARGWAYIATPPILIGRSWDDDHDRVRARDHMFVKRR